jgi:sugar lactone lactonase YvrE
MVRRALVAAALLAGALMAGPGQAALADLAQSLPVISNFGRKIDPRGRLLELNRFPVEAKLTPDGRFAWAVGGAGGGRVRIVDPKSGATVQELDPFDYTGGLAFAPDGGRAYLSSARDQIKVLNVDTASGQPTDAGTIDVKPDNSSLPPVVPPDNLPPSEKQQSFPEGLAVSSDGKTLVAALNLSDRVALIDTASKGVRQLVARPDTKPGDRAMPFGVAIVGRSAFVTNEGDGTIAKVDLDSGALTRVTPAYGDARLANKKKTHPQAIIASPDGKRLYVALTASDRVLELDAADPSKVIRAFDVGRGTGLGTQPVGLAVTGDDRWLFVANSGEDVARVIDLTSGRELSRIPTGIYPNRVLVDEAGGRLHLMSMKGLGPGPTAGTGQNAPGRIIGVLQTLPFPAKDKDRRRVLKIYGKRGDRVPVPVNGGVRPPSNSPLSEGKIKYVFYVVTENKTYDNILGDLERGDGDPCLTLYGEYRRRPVKRDGTPCTWAIPADDWDHRSDDDKRGDRRNDGTPITPNEHRIAREFVTLDRLFTQSETSDDGHIWTAGGYVSDYAQRNTRSPNHPFDVTIPISQPPKGFMFHAAARQGVSFFNYGEAVGVGTLPDSRDTPDELAETGAVLANSEFILGYPSSGAIDKDPITQRLTYDRDPDTQPNPAQGVSRMNYFRKRFNAQLAACPDPSQPATCAVPQYNHLLFPNNHTSGTSPDQRSADALVRDTDQAIGQLLDDLSHSKIWPYTAVFMVQDDAQSGPDHVDGHRITALVASPWAKRGKVVSTHYDDLSVKRTIQIALGMNPTYMYDALATPMWDAFTSKPDFKPYALFDIPEPLMEEKNAADAPMAATSAKQLWVADAVDEGLLTRIQWAARFGSTRGCPPRSCKSAPPEEVAAGRRRGEQLLANLRKMAARLGVRGGLLSRRASGRRGTR